jgi:hypothetical protein
LWVYGEVEEEKERRKKESLSPLKVEALMAELYEFSLLLLSLPLSLKQTLDFSSFVLCFIVSHKTKRLLITIHFNAFFFPENYP